MRFYDEPAAGVPLPMLPGHVSNGRFERVLRAGKFAVTTELAPPDSVDANEVYRRARMFDGYVDAINVTDGSGANCHMSSLAVSALLTRVGYSPILQISCRDRNRIAIQGDLLGGATLGVSNVLCLTGDGVDAGDHPEAKPVFDLDSVTLLGTVKQMREGSSFLSGRRLDSPPRLFMGAAANPFVPPYDYRPLRLKKKIDAGAEFVQSQYCFDIERLKTYMKQVRELGLDRRCFILAGVGPLASARSASWIRDHVPGVFIPDTVIKRLLDAQDQRREGIKICIELIQQIREIDGIAGIHLMAYRMEESVPQIIKTSGVLENRVPWFPQRDQPIEGPSMGQERDESN